MPMPAQSGRQLVDARRTRTHRRGGLCGCFVQKLELDESAIMEASLCDNRKFVAFITRNKKLFANYALFR